MAIQNRRGADAEFDSNKALPGEFGFTTDGTRKVYACFAPGDAREMAFKDQIPVVANFTQSELQEAVNNYLTENPVQAGATKEQTEQIEKNRKAIEDIPTSDTKDNTVTFESADALDSEDNPLAWTDVELLKTGEKHSSILTKISTMFKNVRYLFKVIGMADISELSDDGTVTSALTQLNSKINIRRVNVIGIGTDYFYQEALPGYIIASIIAVKDVHNATCTGMAQSYAGSNTWTVFTKGVLETDTSYEYIVIQFKE